MYKQFSVSIPRICEDSIELRNAFNLVFDLFLSKELIYIEKDGERSSALGSINFKVLDYFGNSAYKQLDC